MLPLLKAKSLYSHFLTDISKQGLPKGFKTDGLQHMQKM